MAQFMLHIMLHMTGNVASLTVGVSMSYTVRKYSQHTSSVTCQICGKEIAIASPGTINCKDVIIEGIDDDTHHFDMCIHHNRRSIETYIKNNLQ